MDSFTKELVSNASEELLPDNTLSSLTNFFTRTTKLGGSMGGCNFRNILPVNVPKHNGGIFQVFWRETFKIYDNLQTGTWSIHFHHRRCGSHEYVHSRGKHTQRNLHNSQGFSQNAEDCIYACKRYLWCRVL